MKIIASVLLFMAVPAFGQAAPPKEAPAPPHSSTPQFSHLEVQMAEDIDKKRDDLQALISDLFEEVRRAHPGFQYDFRTHSLMPVPPPPVAAEQPKPASPEKKDKK